MTISTPNIMIEKTNKLLNNAKSEFSDKSVKIKMFDHDDLDTVGCAILGLTAFGKENINI